MNIEELHAERQRLNAKVLQKNILIQKQSDKIKELDEELSYFINSSQDGMKLIEELRSKVKKANDILAFFDIRMKGNELYEQVKEEIKASEKE